MHPILFKYGSITIYVYGLMIATAFLLGINLMSRQAKKEGYNPQAIFDLGFYILLGAIIGSRLLFVLIGYEKYIHDPIKIFYLWEGGLVFYGGFIGAIGIGYWYLKKMKLPVLPVMDLAAPSLALGQAIGRLGCLASGCCYGRPAEVGWGIVFSDLNCLAPLGVRLHPTQLYQAILDFALFLILISLRRVKKFTGQLTGCYLTIYALSRFGVEFFRGDERGFIKLLGITLSTSQLISIFLFLGGIILLSWAGKKSK